MADRNAYNANTPVPSQGVYAKVLVIGGAIPLVTGDLSLNKTTALFKVPAGFTLTNLAGYITDCDTGGSPALVLAIGDADTANRLVTGSTAGQAGGAITFAVATGLGYKYTAETEIVLKATTAAATAAAGTITLYLMGFLE